MPIAEETDGLGPFPSFWCRIGGLEKGQVASLRAVLVGAEPGRGLASWLWRPCSPDHSTLHLYELNFWFLRFRERLGNERVGEISKIRTRILDSWSSLECAP